MLPVGTSMSVEEYEAWYAEFAWNPNNYPGLEVEQDLSPASWLESLLADRSFTVNMTAPSGYEAYARIFFPFHRSVAGADGDWHEEKVRWSDMARENGKVAHPLMEAETITQPRVGNPAGDQPSSNLSPEQVEAITPILVRHTTSTHGWFLLWDGFGNHSAELLRMKVPKVVHPWREFYLLKGPLDAYTHFADVPNFWWPEDRAWCLSSDTDFSWSYLAGSRACIDEVDSTPVLDALETSLTAAAHSGMDRINDPNGDVVR